MKVTHGLIVLLGLAVGGAYLLMALAEKEPVLTESGLAAASIAVRVHNTESMLNFYQQAFGVQFRQVETSGIQSHFGKLGTMTLKFVPIRATTDFEDYPSHQLGFVVSDVDGVIALAIQHGGRQEGEKRVDGERVHAAIRDPDGNTIELYNFEQE